MTYCAVIGDIVGSRKLGAEERLNVQRRFLSVAENSNKLYTECIESPFTVTIGDEFQVLLKSLTIAPKIIDGIIKEMAPVALVFGVGIGEIVTDINPKLAIGMDGPAFHFARGAIEQAKKKKPKVIYKSDFIGMDMINSLHYFIESCEERRTKRQKQVLGYLNQNYTQEEIAKELGIKQQSVHDIINASYMSEIEDAKRAILNCLYDLDIYNHVSSKHLSRFGMEKKGVMITGR